MNNKFLLAGLLFSIVLFSNACNDGSTISTETFIEGSVSGVTQKGPFQKGSTVTLYEMDELLHQTGNHFSTVIDNDSGRYYINDISMNKPYAWIVVEGEYLDEFTGKKSDQQLTLYGLVDLRKGKQVNINILSHLAFYRTTHLVSKGLSVNEAQAQAETEVLKSFGFESDEQSFEQMNILSNKDGDAKLLAITLILLGSQSNIGFSTNFLAQIAYDIETSGTWNNDSLKSHLRHSTAHNKELGLFEASTKNLISMGASQNDINLYEKYIDIFLSNEAYWAHCSDEGRIKSDEFHYYPQVCHKSHWVDFIQSSLHLIPEHLPDTIGKYDYFTDPRDGHVYYTLSFNKIDGTLSTWMVSPLEYTPTEEIDDPQITNGAGRVYAPRQLVNLPLSAPDSIVKKEFLKSELIHGICPDGWHIPTSYDLSMIEYAIEKDFQIGYLMNVYTEVSMLNKDNEKVTAIDNLFPGTYVIDNTGEDIILQSKTDFYNFSKNIGFNSSPEHYTSLRCVKD